MTLAALGGCMLIESHPKRLLKHGTGGLTAMDDWPNDWFMFIVSVSTAMLIVFTVWALLRMLEG